MRGSTRIYDVRMAQFVVKIEKLSHIMDARGSQDLRSPSPIMAPTVHHAASRFYLFDKEVILFHIIREKRKPEIVKNSNVTWQLS